MRSDASLHGVVRWKTGRNGKPYGYLEIGAERIRIHGAKDSREFKANLERVRCQRKSQPLKTIAQLAAAFLRSDTFSDYRDSTKSRWKGWLTKRIPKELGELSIRVFEDPKSIRVIKKWRSRRKSTPRTADYGLQVLSRILSFAREEGVIREHFCKDVGHIYKGDRSDINWEDDETERLLKAAPDHMRHAILLANFTCLRQGDLLKLQWESVKAHCIQVWTQKSGGTRLVEIPLYPALRALLDAIPRHSEYVLNTERGEPWRTGFGSSWNKLLKRAGIEGKTFHDFRGSGATKLYEAGMSMDDIILLLGWSKKHADNVIERYISRRNQFAVMNEKMQRALGGAAMFDAA
jgi:integrase